MVNLKKLLQPYREAGAFHALLGPHCFVDEQVFLTKANQLGVVLSVDGIDDECLTEATLESISKQMAAAWRGFDERFRIYQYVIKQDQAPVGNASGIADPVARETAENRQRFLESKKLYSIRLVYVLLLDAAQTISIQRSFSSKRVLRVLAQELERRRAVLLGQAHSFERTVGGLLGLRVLPKREAFAFLRLLTNLDREVAGSEELRHDAHVDYFLASSTVACAPDGIRVGEVPLEVLSMKEPPSATFPHVFRDLLAIRANFILCSEGKRVCQTAAVSTIRSAQNHWYWSQWVSDPAAIVSMVMNRGKREEVIADKSAVKDVEALDETLSRVNNAGESLNEFSFTLVLFGPDKVTLQTAVADMTKIFGHHEASLIRESYNALNAFLAIIPGNHAFNLRRTWLLSGNYADLSFLYKPSRGETQQPLVMLETSAATPYGFRLWEDDRLGVLLFGAPGSGKSVLANLFIDHSQKDGPHTFLLDLGGSYRQIAAKHGGSYLRMEFRDGQQSFRINPFVLPHSQDNVQFLFAFLRLLLTNGGYAPTASDEAELFEAIDALYIFEPRQRTLRNLVSGLPPQLAAPLRAWVGDNQYGRVFDNTEDTLTFARFQVFDFQGMDELYPQILEPLLFYIFQRISQVVYDEALAGTPKQLWADEVWRFLANDTARGYLVAAGKTWRKHHGGIGLITQSAADLQNAGILDLVNEVCPKKLLLANPGADLASYQRLFKLNEREVELFAALQPKRQFLEKTATHSKVLHVDLDPQAFWLYANSPRENAARSAALREYGREEGLRRLAAAG